MLLRLPNCVVSPTVGHFQHNRRPFFFELAQKVLIFQNVVKWGKESVIHYSWLRQLSELEGQTSSRQLGLPQKHRQNRIFNSII